ncbi:MULTISPECIES: type II secretion system protein [unclassified Janthinobacterium]|uniref:type II secretion system protein n=2 Tax=Janthinobacterium TaxID=29580 RepID=UPI001614CC6F|nr:MULTISPECIES: type II secretion system protein [unclassified Janthinobacterium]MBB5368338.1 general secretion pathway protein G [Janthinobacterium sp. K2C7]MBB5382126.1 general secretion pathway protein G [Janthinobacterium sp. K2Li3]MBB5386720.1 general secretion pathway protein G [Janthinobacterium sp. K2E3]
MFKSRRPGHALRAGYTTIELLVVMAVLGILATAAMPLVELTATRNKERELKQALWEIRRAIDGYKQAYDAGRIGKTGQGNGYPPSLAVLVQGVPDLTAGGQTMYLLRRLPRDPFAPADAKAEASWGLRSYLSPPEAPKEGEDVFDVYSTSDKVGMNGIAYRLW